jgi:hypothetical protein
VCRRHDWPPQAWRLSLTERCAAQQEIRSGKKKLPKPSGWQSSTSVEKRGGILAQFSFRPLAATHHEQK